MPEDTSFVKLTADTVDVLNKLLAAAPWSSGITWAISDAALRGMVRAKFIALASRDTPLAITDMPERANSYERKLLFLNMTPAAWVYMADVYMKNIQPSSGVHNLPNDYNASLMTLLFPALMQDYQRAAARLATLRELAHASLWEEVLAGEKGASE